jgi:hypothetical protein
LRTYTVCEAAAVVQEPTGVVHAVRHAVSVAGLYGAAASRILPRGGRSLGARLAPAEERLVFVVGSPRSGTTFLGETLGGIPGFVDLSEVTPLKAVLPELASLPEQEAAVRLRRVLETVRRLALVRGLRGIEQTPETTFVLGAALRAYPRARAVHILRDGRDFVCSLLERGWLRAGRGGRDDAHLPYGPQRRFWVEPARAEEFEHASDATRAAWAWSRYVRAARAAAGERTLEIRYEDVAADPDAVAARVAEHLDAPVEPLAAGLAQAHARSIGRFRRDLTEEQLADVEREAGPLLRELGYE